MEATSALTTTIKAEALRLGFPLMGVALPEPPAHFSVFANWLTAGRQAEMGYLASERALERRANPRRILSGVRSILSVGIPYANPAEQESHAGYGRVAAYAWGNDYHEVIPSRLIELAERIEKQFGVAIHRRAYTDTGPILERDLAQRAGLGWIGKNTCLIHPRFGSYFLLGELFLDVELEPSDPVEHDYCGGCRRCIDACPTSCILPDRTIDAGRCISYLTIENKASIPAEIRKPIGDWVFGCDICQQVCPWNLRFAHLPADIEMVPRSGIPQPELRVELQLGSQEFNQKFRGSPILRPHRRGYLRNVAVAMGNLADPSTLPHLNRALETDPEALVRGHVAWAIGQIGGKQAKAKLERALHFEPDGYVQSEIRSALR
ncbi:MAG: tRNA epoxyqueuosine(34) reductase QueG [Anaerolineaceae bacterium]|nr:tRNA epoxyqueuosine(34) reductase QueG [Anaerolineaceae bacterium]